MEPGAPLATEPLKVSICSQPVLLAHHVTGSWSVCHKPGVAPCHTVRRWRPFSRLDLRTFRPPLVFILALNPCTRLRRRTLGCHVLFGMPIPLLSELQHAIIPAFFPPCKSMMMYRRQRQPLPAVFPCPVRMACIFGCFGVESNLKRVVKARLALCVVFDTVCGIIVHVSCDFPPSDADGGEEK
jgi:hypothetical protein